MRKLPIDPWRDIARIPPIRVRRLDQAPPPAQGPSLNERDPPARGLFVDLGVECASI
jgi:hypothetical protein